MPESHSDFMWSKKREHLPMIAGAVDFLLVVGALVTLVTTIANLRHFRDVGYPDSAILLRVEAFSLTGQMYPDFNHPPYLITPYGPLCYILLGGVFKLTQFIRADPRTLLRFSMIASYGICLLAVYRMSRYFYAERRWALLSILFVISSASFAPWIVQIRGDLPALALSLSSMYLYLSATGKRRRLFAAIFAALALLVKQTFFAAPCAILICLLRQREFREGLCWLGIVTLIIVTGYTWAFLREPLIVGHFRALGMSGLEFAGAFELIGEAFFQPQALFGALGAFLALREQDSRKSVFVCYWLVSWIVALLTIFQVGGDSNYFWEPLLSSAVLGGSGFIWFTSKLNKAPTFLKLFIASILCCVFFPVLNSQIRQTAVSYWRLKTHDYAKAEWNSFLSKITGYRLLSTFPDLTIHSQIPEVPDPFLNSALARRGNFSFTPILRDVRAGKYDIVVVRPDLAAGGSLHRGVRIWTSDIWEALRKNYTQVCVLQNMEVWLPKEHSSKRLNSIQVAECKFISR